MRKGEREGLGRRTRWAGVGPSWEMRVREVERSEAKKDVSVRVETIS